MCQVSEHTGEIHTCHSRWKLCVFRQGGMDGKIMGQHVFKAEKISLAATADMQNTDTVPCVCVWVCVCGGGGECVIEKQLYYTGLQYCLAGLNGRNSRATRVTPWRDAVPVKTIHYLRPLLLFWSPTLSSLPLHSSFTFGRRQQWCCWGLCHYRPPPPPARHGRRKMGGRLGGKWAEHRQKIGK